MILTHGYFYNTETRAPQWLSDTWSMSLQSPYQWYQLHREQNCCLPLQVAVFSVLTEQRNVQRGSLMLLLQKLTRRRKLLLCLAQGMEQQLSHIRISSGCMLALMVDSASMVMEDMKQVQNAYNDLD